MFRACSIRLAPLATLKPVLAVSVKSHASVRRMVGFRLQRLPNAGAIQSIIEKTKGEGLAGWAASVSRCALYLGAHNLNTAIAELDGLIPKITDEPLKRHAIGIRLRARNQLLDSKEASLSVSGGASESEVSDIRARAKEDYEALKASSPGCWLVQLGCAEYSLYTGSPQAAFDEFCQVEEQIKKFIASPVNMSEDIATNGNTAPYTLLGFRLQRVFNAQNLKVDNVSKTVAEGMLSIAKDPEAAAALAELKKELGGNLSDEEVLEVAITMHIANIRHHFMDYFKSSSQYEDWDSEAAKNVKGIVHRVYNPSSTSVSESVMANVRSTTPPEAFYVSDDKLRQALKSAPKDQSIVKAIRSTFGPGPRSALSKADEAFEEAVKSVLAAGDSADTAGTTSFAKKQVEWAKILAQQYLYRTQVQKAVALIQMGRLHEAVEVLNPVINADEYVYMWRALLARSQAYKGLGLITNSDKDHKTLERLRKSLTSHPPYEVC